MATTRKYDNGKSGWTDYDEKGNAVAAGTYNAPGTERNPYSTESGKGVNSGDGSLWNNATGQKVSVGSSANSPTRSAKNPYDTSSQLSKLKQAQLAASMAALDKSRNSSLSNLSAEKATIEPMYQKEKMQAGVTAKQTARSFSEYMAQRGGGAGASGIGGQGELLNNMAYQKQYGELGQAETGALTDNARRVTDLNNAYESDVVGAKAGVEASYLQNYITQMNADRAFEQQKRQFDISSNQAQQQITNQASQFAQSFGLSEKQFANTITQQGLDNAYRDKTFAQAADQFAQTIGLSRDQYKSSLEQWAKTFEQSNSQFDQTLALQKAQLAASQAKSSSGGGSGSGSSGSAAKLTVGQQANYATADALDAIRRDGPNMTRGEFDNAMNSLKPQFIRDGVDMGTIQDAIDSVQTRDETEAANNTISAEQGWNNLPWWKKAADVIIPGDPYSFK